MKTFKCATISTRTDENLIHSQQNNCVINFQIKIKYVVNVNRHCNSMRMFDINLASLFSDVVAVAKQAWISAHDKNQMFSRVFLTRVKWFTKFITSANFFSKLMLNYIIIHYHKHYIKIYFNSSCYRWFKKIHHHQIVIRNMLYDQCRS